MVALSFPMAQQVGIRGSGPLYKVGPLITKLLSGVSIYRFYKKNPTVIHL